MPLCLRDSKQVCHSSAAAPFMYALEDMGITALPADADEDIVRASHVA